MRLLLITTVFPTPREPTKGPFNRTLVKALAAAGHEVAVVAPVPWTVALATTAPVPGGERPEALTRPYRETFPTYYFTPKVLRSWYGHFLWLSIRATVRDLLRNFRPDAVLGYWAHPDGEAAVRAAAAASVPAVIIVGGSDVLLLTRDAARRRRVLGVLSSADAVLAVGPDLRARLLDMGLPPDRLHVLSRGVDESVFHPGDRAEARSRLGVASAVRLLLWVGRMVPVKGLDVLLAACARLQQGGTTFRLALVGDGPLRRSLGERAVALGLGDAVMFVGSVAHDRLGDWYRAADLTVLPSRSEGVPNVLLESLACGTPFVATRVGGIPSLAGDPRSLVPPGDAGALAEALHRALEGPLDHGDTPRTRFDWGESVEALVDVVRRAISERGGASPSPLREMHLGS
jgi:glycosyltransferase involved in cell wall biosynthesis